MKRPAKAQAKGDLGNTLPPYISLNTFKTLILDFKLNSVPRLIDTSVITTCSGAGPGQLINALKYLQLIDAQGCSSEQLRSLVDAYNTDDWKSALRSVIIAAYPSVLVADLDSASLEQIYKRFRSLYGGAPEVLKKCIRFLINAALDAGVSVGQRLTYGKKLRKLAVTSPDSPQRKSVSRRRNKIDPIKQFIELFDLSALGKKQKDAFNCLLEYLQKNRRCVADLY